MKISLITPSYQHADFIGRTIDSVLDQRGEFELDYAVLDGGSTDGTVEILKSYGDRLRWSSQLDHGQIDAVNRGLQAATGDVIGWLNSDDLLLPGALQKVCAAFGQTKCHWMHGGCQIIDRRDREIRKWVSALKRFHSLRYTHGRLLCQNFISQMTVFWRRELMAQVGLLDAVWPLAFDYDYWLRLSAVAEPHYIDSPIAAFRWYDASKSGASYVAQCREDEAIAHRHGLKGWARSGKRLQNRLRISAYRLYNTLQRT
jgi:glycosyltransferase involved in cell wall biosynthesis